MPHNESLNRWYAPGGHSHRGKAQTREKLSRLERLEFWSAGTHKTSETSGATVAPATDAVQPRAGPGRVPADSERRRGLPADWRHRARRYIRSTRLRISPRDSVGPSLYGFSVSGCELKAARRARFQGAAFNQRVSPASQCGDVHINPVLPPVQRASIVSKLRSLFGSQDMRQLFDVVGRKVVFIQQNER